MKRLLLVIALMLGYMASASAQDFYLGGSLGVSYSKLELGGDSDQSGLSFKILPEFGYRLGDHWAVGLNVGYMRGYAALGSFDPSDLKALANAVVSTAADIASDDMVDFKPQTFHVAPYCRYMAKIAGRLEFFLDGMVGFNMIKAGAKIAVGDESMDIDDQKLQSFEVCLRPGLAFALSDKVKLNMKIGSLGFQTLKLKDTDLKLTRFGLDVDNSNLLLGVNYSF